MSNAVKITQRAGAYEHPFSGRGIEFNPLGTGTDQAGISLHEAGYDPCNSDWNFPSVLSPFWRVYYNSEPSHCIVFGDEFHQLGPDHIVLIPDHRFFHCLGQHPTPSFWIHFSYNRNPAPGQPIPILLPPEKTEVDLIRSISQLAAGDQPPNRNRIYHLALALLNLLISRPEIAWRPSLPEPLTHLIRFIENNAHLKVPNQRLAQEIGVSVEGVYRLFRKHLGTSPANYINQIRIRKASHLLLGTQTSIDGIAEATGFPNRAYFSRVFKLVTNTTPAAFRDRPNG
ncbi:HTH-type transcriptional activator Btr [Pontiella desulfatans]|uniref:HTH-type transcriptional activator Btr n=1 Tax=Pontiella desulfatans TaxID=2750659 RepID=A0A6C2U3L4_PONDE|nr:AraC family transcriptional regulator [Pontiella desulfatans]VGO14389.1 HTH-type transcriptional activator Btr [Pontiella desulfatans]